MDPSLYVWKLFEVGCLYQRSVIALYRLDRHETLLETFAYPSNNRAFYKPELKSLKPYIDNNQILIWWIETKLSNSSRFSKFDSKLLLTIPSALSCKWLIRLFCCLPQNIQTKGQYPNWGSINVFISDLRRSRFKTLQALPKTLSFFLLFYTASEYINYI